MASYRLPELIQDVAKKRGKLNAKSKEAKLDYQEVWDAFNRYITSNMLVKKGLSVQNFFKIGWSVEKKRTGGATYRPYIQFQENFLKAHGMDKHLRPAPAADKDLCQMEEMNYSKAAIRYSSTLTKDQVFTGLRMLVFQIGEACGEGKNVCIEFEMGNLICQEGEPRFAFAAELYLAEGLQVPSGAADDLEYKPSVSFAPPSKEALSLRLEGSNISNIGSAASHDERGNTGASLASGASQSGYCQSSRCAPIAEAPLGSEVTGEDRDWSYNPCSESGADVLSLNKDVSHKLESSEVASSRGSVTYGSMRGGGAPPQMMEDGMQQQLGQFRTRHEHAFQEAMDRHITEIECQANEAVRSKEQWENHLQNCLVQERKDMEWRRALAKENSELLQEQMAQNERKRADGRQQYIEGASAHDFPNFADPPQQELRDYSKGKQRELKEELDAQVLVNQHIAEKAKAKERNLECGQVDACKQEIAQLRLEQKIKKEHEREQLAQHWDRDVRLKKIKKAIEVHHTRPVPLPSDMRSAIGASQAVSFEGPPLSARSGPPSDRGLRMPGRRTPLGAAGSLALQRERLNSGLSY
eukprot:gnl/MRDRNA2_/MRDRNA2_92215_c0_seq1.p1 gnl/MRDRNA2_/MRDRNA2_92215_c0~~gnl/MRDRNA2_/MRDRNA2_92215_c0_seq1.p1  ORF type:complete len:583 (+),score=130.50 gnl/MRDRNA2_/MRDRNA2_92215_c0_seq1:98-1846(+)